MKAQDLHEKAALLTLFRLVVALVLLIATLFFSFREGEALVTGTAAEILYGAVTLLLMLSAAAALLLERFADAGRVTVLAYVQVVGDALFSSALVSITGGCESLFTFLFSLAIVNAGVILYRRGAFFAALVNAVCLSGVVLIQAEVFGPKAAQFISAGALFSEEVLTHPELRDLLPHYVVNVLAFFGIALLSGFLAQQLKTAAAVAEQQRAGLRELANLHENIVSSLENGLITLSMDRKVTYANNTACALAGRPQAEVVGRNVADIFPDMGPVLDNPAKLNSTRSEVTIHVSGGRTLYLRWSISPLRDSAGVQSGHILLLFDTTHMREMEEQVKRSEHLAALGRLATSLAHEIRNPLASMSGSIQLLRDSLNVEGSDRKLMEIVVREADSLSRWIGEFLEFARPRKFQMEQVDLAELAREAVEMLRNDERSQGVALMCSADGACVISGDRVRLNAVVWNLAINAVQAVSGAGSVTVAVAADGDDAVLTVTDSGPGIPPDVQKHMFEPFFTTRESGTGLGLATVHRNVVDHRGTIAAASGPSGVGTVFTVRVPKSLASPPPPVSETGQWRRA